MAKKSTAVPAFPHLSPGDAPKMLTKLPAKAVNFSPVKRRYSVTGDILSYRRCKRQYGFFSRRGYTSAQSGQLFFGTVIHETLDRAHAHYRGEIENVEKGSFPQEPDITHYFTDVEEALHARGIRPLSKASRDKALEYVVKFNEANGKDAYPRVFDTEHRLEKDKGDFVLHGIVDVIAQTEVGVGAPGDWGAYEIWDYKGSKKPKEGTRELEDYKFQMRVYAHLYELRNGARPKRAILWFLGEPDVTQQQYEVKFTDAEIEAAVAEFESTVGKVEETILKDNWSDIKKQPPPTEETCVACDIRWNCPNPAKPQHLRPL